MPEALIWGASGGIGQALARLLKEQGWRVYAVARHPERIPTEVDAEYEFEAAQAHSFEQAAMFVAQETEALDLVVYASGGLQADKLAAMPQSGWEQVLDSNLHGAYLAAQHSLPLLKEGGQMVFIGAYIDHLILPKMGAYAVAKAGLEPMVQILQKENRKHKFTLLRPGAVDTPFWNNAPFRLPKNAKQPAQIARAILERFESGESGDLDL